MNAFAATEMEKLSTEARSTVKMAAQCIPRVEKKNTVFCTGFQLPEGFLQKIADTNTCRAEIKKHGFTVVMDNSEAGFRKTSGPSS